LDHADVGYIGGVRTAILIALPLTLSCAGTPSRDADSAKARPAEPVPQRAETVAAIPDSRWGALETRRFSLQLRLPDRPAWRVDDAGDRWLVAVHRASSSTLRVRTWQAPRIVRPADCEAQVRLWRNDIPGADLPVIERRELTAPDGFQTTLTVAIEPRPRGLRGTVTAFGASVGRCYAALYETDARGDAAEDVIGRRLALMVDGVFAQVRAGSIDDRGHAVRALP
jgi:hypothetical protein